MSSCWWGRNPSLAHWTLCIPFIFIPIWDESTEKSKSEQVNTVRLCEGAFLNFRFLPFCWKDLSSSAIRQEQPALHLSKPQPAPELVPAKQRDFQLSFLFFTWSFTYLQPKRKSLTIHIQMDTHLISWSEKCVHNALPPSSATLI